MAKKYYAVKAGYVPGIYETWDECKKQVNGFSGATYKGFLTRKEAETFLGLVDSQATADSQTSADSQATADSQTTADLQTTADSQAGALAQVHRGTTSEAVAYVDGSYQHTIRAFAYGVVLFYKEREEHFFDKMDDPDLVEMRNVAGEIKAAEKAMQFCVDNHIQSIDIHHDYEGIAKWCTGEWKANKAGTKAYKAFYDGIKSDLRVRFIKVKGHSGDQYNDLADQLAKRALGIGEPR